MKNKIAGIFARYFFMFTMLKNKMDNLVITPIENFIFNGIVNKLHKVFGCFVQFVNSESRVQTMQSVRKNARLPYMFVLLDSINYADQYYNANYLSRHGLTLKLADTKNALARVKFLPCTFNMRVEYLTNKRDGDNSTVFFIKRWMFARRLGYLKFDVTYGEKFSCPVQMDDQISQPIREQETEGMALYTIEANLSINGFVSESQILTSGVLNDLSVETKVSGCKQSENAVFWEWPKK